MLANPPRGAISYASAEEPVIDTVVRPRASAFLPPDHWTLEALRRLYSLGLTPWDHDPGMLSLPRGEAARILAHAREEAKDRDAEIRALVEGYAARFAGEFPAASRALLPPRSDVPTVEGAAVVGGAVGRDRLLARGWSAAGDSRRGPVPMENLTAALAGARIAAYPGRSLALELRGEGRLGDGPGREVVEAAYATLTLGDLGIWAGRRVPGWGAGRGGRVLLDRRHPFDGAGIFLTEGVRLPWILEHLGPIRFETFAAELDRSGLIVEPWFWGLRGSLSPHPRLKISAAAATFFGGENNPVPTTMENIFKMVTLQLVSSSEAEGNFSNGHAAAEFWWRPPTGNLPLSLYYEHGFGDTAGGYFDVPAITVGARVDAVPGARALSLGLEGSYFGPPQPPAHSPTYRAGLFGDHWTREGRLYGHPLGGTGREARVYTTIHTLDARLRLRADIYLRNRGTGNLFVPERDGDAGGLEGRVAYRRDDLEVSFRGSLETDLGAGLGESWTETEAALQLRAFFPGGSGR